MDRLNYINKLVKSKYKISLYNPDSNANPNHSHSHKQRQKQIKENTIIELYNICSNNHKAQNQSPKSKIK
jgi:hypothetical protein